MENPFWDWASKNYKQVILAFGSHEFYNNYDLSAMEDGFKYKVRDNVYYYYNCVIKIDDVDIIVSTLWSYINKEYAKKIQKIIRDFKLIKWGNKALSVEEYNKEHEKCLNFIKKSLSESKAKTKIVVTYFVPSNLLIPKEFEGQDINEAFTVDLTEYIQKCGAKFWIFGKSHRNINKIIGKTSCICNQMGYISQDEHLTFDGSKSFDVNYIKFIKLIKFFKY